MNEVQKYDGSVNNFTELQALATHFAKSGLFADTREATQALVKIQAGTEIGIKPFAAMSGIHIIKGKPSIGSGIIAAKIKASIKYDYRVIEHTDKVCKIEFLELENGKKVSIGISVMEIEALRKAGSQNLDKFPRNMLFARAISNGLRFYCPDVFECAVYTPDELGVETNEDETPIAKPSPEYVNYEPVTPVVQPAATEAAKPSADLADRIVKLETAFNAIGVNSMFLLAYINNELGKASISELDALDLETLATVYKAVKADPTKISTTFPTPF
jgi:hypothetical protein